MKGRVLTTGSFHHVVEEVHDSNGLEIAADVAAAPAPGEKTEDLGGEASCPRKVMRERAKPRSAGRGDEFQPGKEVTPELGFEGWVGFHRADRGGQRLRKWEQLGKAAEGG